MTKLTADQLILISVGFAAIALLLWGAWASWTAASRESDIAKSTRELAAHFKGVVGPPPWQELHDLYERKDFTGLTSAIKKSFKLENRLRVGYVNSGGDPRSPAWVQLPAHMPIYGTDSFRNTTVTMFIRKDFLARMPFDTVVCAIAHEMAHIVLEATWHPRRKDERIVDLTAMVLGYAQFYRTGVTHVETSKVWDHVKGPGFVMPGTGSRVESVETTRHKLGYLNVEEVQDASKVITKLLRQQTRKGVKGHTQKT